MFKRVFFLFGFIFFLSLTNTSCKTKEGCGLESKYAPDMETKSGGKSNLFSKKQRKKMKS